ncbi:hypothetical protein QFC22_000372 [Naganishia vaughanmartiniae]|uniref:Uncharacterized protein n=1 Tax=Naganishia vaughanmartiniae TaxID=1424756 RepID=A0ACC2XQ54_9TREE|nr:hypothetical protein QFC22_000372 [Naganishia vaughanmartiniae]
MTNVFQAVFPSQQQSTTQLNSQTTECGAAHARMLGKRQRSASPPTNGDESVFGHQQKRNKPFWTATPILAGHDGSGQHMQNITGTPGFFDFSKTAIVEHPNQQQTSHYQFAQNTYPFPFPSPNNLSPSGLVLPDSTMSSNSIFPTAQGFPSAPATIAARAIDSNDVAPSPLHRESSHGSFASLHELRERMASSGLRGYKDLPQVMDDSDAANDGDDEMLISDSVMHTMRIGPDSTMDVSMPRPPRNSFSSVAPGGDGIDHGAMGKPFATMLSDRFGQTTPALQTDVLDRQNISKRSNASDGLGAAEQYFVDGMRGVEQQHKEWNSPTDITGPEGQQQLRSGGDIDMVCARLSGLQRRLTS